MQVVAKMDTFVWSTQEYKVTLKIFSHTIMTVFILIILQIQNNVSRLISFKRTQITAMRTSVARFAMTKVQDMPE